MKILLLLINRSSLIQFSSDREDIFSMAKVCNSIRYNCAAFRFHKAAHCMIKSSQAKALPARYLYNILE